ncbi:MAG: 50S ribosomal protein L9 [Bacteroidia bacterium]|nr:50S ribosomal protein L9 [Bacteroidia bacterium]
MEVILTKDVDKLGYKNDLVKVKPGYGRNFLVPQGLAILATESSKKVLAENLKQRAFKEEKIKKDAEGVAETLKKTTLKVAAKAGESGKIFGSVNSIQIADAIKSATGKEIERKNITLVDAENIKTLGTYKAKVKVHREITVEVDFEVVAE